MSDGIPPLLPPSWEDVVSLLSALVAINSINPSLVPGAPGEREIAEYVAIWLRDAGLQIELVEASPGRPSVVARLPGARNGRSLLLNAHLDTVGMAGMQDGLRPRVEGDRLYGRGAYDMKGSLAAIMLAVRSLARIGGAGGDVIVTAVADEEYASLGTEAVVRRYSADAAIVTEPTGLELCTAHKGFAWIEVETIGKAAHGSKPELGVDAITHMGRVLIDIETLGHDLSERPGHRLLGTGSVHASLIEGGQELSSYPERCRLQLERRTIPGETRDTVRAEIIRLLSRREAEDPRFSAVENVFFWRDPFEVAEDAPIVRVVSDLAAEVLGTPPRIYGDTPWMDAAILSAAGISTVVFGPGGMGAHGVVEYSFISEVVSCAEILARTALSFCDGYAD
jgi:acetylornithine deacetylase